MEYDMRIGSEEHKQLFCQSFMDSHRVYEPEQMSFPQLDSETLDRLRSIPFWDEALHTERKAGKMLEAYAATVKDPVIQAAIALQGREEARHGRLIGHLINHYGIELPQRPERELPTHLEPAFIKFGYGECFDSFFAFGLFAIARESGVMPEVFFTIFDPILDEEARHMVFFINWIAYKQINEGSGAFRHLNSLWQYAGAVQRRLDNLKGSGKKKKDGTQKGFTATGAKSFMMGLTLEKFLHTCIAENDRRMSIYDDRLLRPEVLPILSGLGLRAINLLPKKKSRSTANAAT
jgi:hypothetical protein